MFTVILKHTNETKRLNLNKVVIVSKESSKSTEGLSNLTSHNLLHLICNISTNDCNIIVCIYSIP